jgi:histidinol-phosphate/aromatic aminotransferase/cobyric acid decarboxylase-like protein
MYVDPNPDKSVVAKRKSCFIGELTKSNLTVDWGKLLQKHFRESKLRKLIAKQSASNISADDVIVTAGAAGALFIVSSSLLEREDQIVIAFPNFGKTGIKSKILASQKICFPDPIIQHDTSRLRII